MGRPCSLNTPKALSDELHGEVFCEQRMELARRQPGNFEVQIVRLPTKHEVAYAAADQPRPAAGAANQLFNLAQWPRERGVLDAKANRHLQRRLPQKLRRFFRCHRIDVEPCAPFEARHLGQLRNDFDVPVVEVAGLFVEGRTMEDKVVGRPSEDLVHPSERFGENRREELELCLLALFEVAGVAFRENPHFKGKAWGKRGDAEELGIFRHDAIAVREILPENIAIDAAFFLNIMSPTAIDLLHGRWWG